MGAQPSFGDRNEQCAEPAGAADHQVEVFAWHRPGGEAAALGMPVADRGGQCDVLVGRAVLVRFERDEMVRVGGVGDAVHLGAPAECGQRDAQVVQGRTATEQ